MKAIKLNKDNFDSAVSGDKPVLLDFYADWCGPCKMMSPVIEKLAAEYDGKIKVGKINVDDYGEIAEKYNVMSIPNMVFIKNGEVVDRQIGAVPAPALKAKFDGVLA